MKKVVISILAVLYLGLASGVMMNLHYCMGQLSSVEYGYDEHNHCDKCGMEQKDGCCNTEFKLVKLQDSHQWAKSDWLAAKYISTLTFFTSASYRHTPLHHRVIDSRYYSPPDYRMNAIYLHTSILRI